MKKVLKVKHASRKRHRPPSLTRHLQADRSHTLTGRRNQRRRFCARALQPRDDPSNGGCPPRGPVIIVARTGSLPLMAVSGNPDAMPFMLGKVRQCRPSTGSPAPTAGILCLGVESLYRVEALGGCGNLFHTPQRISVHANRSPGDELSVSRDALPHRAPAPGRPQQLPKRRPAARECTTTACVEAYRAAPP